MWLSQSTLMFCILCHICQLRWRRWPGPFCFVHWMEVIIPRQKDLGHSTKTVNCKPASCPTLTQKTCNHSSTLRKLIESTFDCDCIYYTVQYNAKILYISIIKRWQNSCETVREKTCWPPSLYNILKPMTQVHLSMDVAWSSFHWEITSSSILRSAVLPQ